jgi:adenylate cyclase
MKQKSTPFGNSAATREIRSASLRFVVLSILFANLLFGERVQGGDKVYQ